MIFARLKKGAVSIRRFPELFRCVFEARNPARIILSYLGLKSMRYPTQIALRDGTSLQVFSWDDLTTAWVVWFGREYILRDNEWRIVDLGANIGAFTLLAARNPNRSIIAVEPFPETFARLKANVLARHTDERVELIQAAADCDQRILWMSSNPTTPSHSRSVSTAAVGEDSVGTPTITISELVEHAGGFIDFLKIDIEGHEYALLEGTEALCLERIGRIGMEYHGQGGHLRIQDSLKRAGFELVRHRPQEKRGLLEFTRRP